MSNVLTQRNTLIEKAIQNKSTISMPHGSSSARPNYHIEECATKPQAATTGGASFGIDKPPMLFQTQRCYSGY